MLRVPEVRAERPRARPVLLVLEELLGRGVPEEEAVRSPEKATRAGAPGWVGGLGRATEATGPEGRWAGES